MFRKRPESSNTVSALEQKLDVQARTIANITTAFMNAFADKRVGCNECKCGVLSFCDQTVSDLGCTVPGFHACAVCNTYFACVKCAAERGFDRPCWKCE